ncbi:unnamed protein product [Nezara viridula]|uniref:Peptidase A1 domain-containing protein n=1 Tax=Nezara viridula TaxID=85310 RepID=A0A9P0HTQ1_NEZVI|nr:unnamed protein product [Nezara viridula]
MSHQRHLQLLRFFNSNLYGKRPWCTTVPSGFPVAHCTSNLSAGSRLQELKEVNLDACKMGSLATFLVISSLAYFVSGTELKFKLHRKEGTFKPVTFPTVRRSASLTFKNLRNEEYWASLTIGTPPQKFEAMFDTGSHLLWVPNRNCSNCYHKNMFDESKSSSYVDLNRSISIDYAIGYMRGRCGKDVVNIAGIEVKDQEMATALEGAFQENLFDGIVGLSFSPNRPDVLTSVLENFLSQKLLKRNVMSFYMNRKGDPKDGGEFVLGGWNKNLFDPEKIEYIQTESYDWGIKIESMYFGKEKGYCNNCYAIADTGSTMITGPINEMMIYINKLNAEELEDGYHFVKCDRVDSLPDWTIMISGKRFTLKPWDYTFTNSSHPGYCMLGFTGNYETDWVLGTMFLSNYYTVFDIEKRRVAFAPLKVDKRNY